VTRTETQVTIVEVGPRDGFQSIAPIIPTPVKTALIERLHAAGVRRMESTSFVSEKAVPQLADAPAIVEATARLPGLDAQVLVPTARHAERALAAGARHLSAVLSVSERHNMGNVRRTPLESAADYAQTAAIQPDGAGMRRNLATAFDNAHCGPVEASAGHSALERLLGGATRDPTRTRGAGGEAGPGEGRGPCGRGGRCSPEVLAWAFHGHDTYGLGAANALTAWDAGVRIFDAAVAGLGGCPFAPGATGNVATEDLVWMFDRMGIATGIDLERLIEAADMVAELPGAQVGGRVRNAIGARANLAVAS